MLAPVSDVSRRQQEQNLVSDGQAASLRDDLASVLKSRVLKSKVLALSFYYALGTILTGQET